MTKRVPRWTPHGFFAVAALGLLAIETEAAPALRKLDVGPKPESVCRGFDGKLCVTLMGERREPNDGDGSVVLVDGQTVTPLATGFNDPKGIDFTGTLLVTTDKDTVWTIDAKGHKSVLAGPDAFPDPPLYLNDLVVSPDGKSVLVTDMGATTKMLKGPGELWPLDSPEARTIPALARIYRIGLADGKVSIVVDHAKEMPIPNGLDVLADGTLLIAEFFLGHLLEWKAGTWRIIGDDYRSADGVAHDAAGRVYVSEVFTGRVWRVQPDNGKRTLLATLESAADHILDPETNTVIVPDTKAGQLVFVPAGR